MNLNDIAPLSKYNLNNTVLGNNSDNSKFTAFLEMIYLILLKSF